MSNPLVKKDLMDAILELRADVERQLQANKYYVALNKLDELLAAIRPLEITEATALETRQAAEPAKAGRGRAARSWSGSCRKRWSRARAPGRSRHLEPKPRFRFDSWRGARFGVPEPLKSMPGAIF